MDETLSPDDPVVRSEAPRPHLVEPAGYDDFVDDANLDRRHVHLGVPVIPRTRLVPLIMLALALFLLGFGGLVAIAASAAHSSRDISAHIHGWQGQHSANPRR